MAEETSMYEKLGIDSMKSGVRQIFKSLIDNDFPGAWVNIVRDPDHPGEVFTQHNDGDGSKFVQRLLIYKETGDVSVIRGAVDDALQMNLGDIAASGFVSGKIVVTDIIDINGFSAPKEIIMREITRRFEELKEFYHQAGFQKLYFLGGETADLPDQVRSVVFNVCVYARAKESDIISGNVQSGDEIYGFQSSGRSIWENEPYNFGLGANGLTLARIKAMSRVYTDKYPELIRSGGSYTGEFQVGDTCFAPDLNFCPDYDISRALISPTRQWSILIAMLIKQLKSKGIFGKLHGISFNTGGGAAKIKHLGRGGILYVKRMPQPPPIFRKIKELSGETWENMHKTFNCGIGIDVVGEACDEFREALSVVAAESGIPLHFLGYCKPNSSGNQVELITNYGNFYY